MQQPSPYAYAQMPAAGAPVAQPLAYAAYPTPAAAQPAPAGVAGGHAEGGAASRFNSEIPVGSVLGIPVRLHVMLPAVTVLYTLNAWLVSTAAAIFMFLLTGPVLYGSVFIHELGHCQAARRVGGHVDGILLWPLGGLAYIGHSGAAKDDLLIAVAGPLTHAPQAAVWGILYAIAHASHSYGWIWLTSSALWMQLSLLLFNLCPAYPLDGGRAVVDLLSMRGVGLERAAAITAGLSVSVGAVICLLALAYAKWTTIMVGAWVLMQAWELLQMVRRGEARQHPMFVCYEERVQSGGGALPPSQMV